jgi:hypothetical protein
MPTKSELAKSHLFAPSLECARRIDDQDNAVQAAVYSAETKLAELRSRYESECLRIRAAMLAEIAALEIRECEA